MVIVCLSNLLKLFIIFISQKKDVSSLEINSSGQLALKTENRTLNRFLVQTYLTGIVMLDDNSQEMRCFQNKSINLFLLQILKVINAYSQVLI